MEGLAPPVKLLLSIRCGIERGESIRSSLQTYFLKADDELARLVATWVSLRDQGKSTNPVLKQLKSPFRRAAIMLIDRGLRGESILGQVVILEEEVIEASKSELETFLGVLPIKMLIPLLLFQFPAFLLLLFGPLLSQLLSSF